MQVRAIKTKIFSERDDLFEFILAHVKKIPEGSILVVASKIVALSEGRTVNYKNDKEKNKLIKTESDFAIQTKHVWLTVKDKIIMASAGIDESNAAGKLILLPTNSFSSAHDIRVMLKKKFKVKNLGVIITDSGLVPLRSGVVGVALGYAGFKGVKSYKGKKDLFRRKFVYSQVDVADSIATAATLCMGEGAEAQPLALVTNAPVVFQDRINKSEISMNPAEDIYAPILKHLYAPKK